MDETKREERNEFLN